MATREKLPENTIFQLSLFGQWPISCNPHMERGWPQHTRKWPQRMQTNLRMFLKKLRDYIQIFIFLWTLPFPLTLLINLTYDLWIGGQGNFLELLEKM